MQKTVVIVDDSPFIVDLLTSFFSENMRFKVLATGNNGRQAVSLCKQYRPDLISMDLTMPVMDGNAALKEILDEFKEARILMITSQLAPDYRVPENGCGGVRGKTIEVGKPACHLHARATTSRRWKFVWVGTADILTSEYRVEKQSLP